MYIEVPDLIPESIEVDKGVYWGGNFESLKHLLNEGLIESDELRFFLGYSGWEKEQLSNELSSNSWFISENDFENIFSSENESLWRNKLIQKGGNYKLWANAPSDINLN